MPLSTPSIFEASYITALKNFMGVEVIKKNEYSKLVRLSEIDVLIDT